MSAVSAVGAVRDADGAGATTPSARPGHVAVIGSGVMGTGIAHAFCLKGYEVEVVDAERRRADRSVEQIGELLVEAVRRAKLSEPAAAEALARVRALDRIADVTPGADLIVEAVPEQLALKVAVLREAEARTPRLLATNTSALSVSLIARDLAHPEQLVGMHFFNPVWAMSLVEVVIGERTEPSRRDAACELAGRIGKEAIVVRDTPGFATSRLGVALGLEAIRMVAEGVASAADIDRAMELGYRHPMGPLRLGDLVGLDVRLDIARNLEQALGPRFEPPELLVQMVAKGWVGKKAGRGFYDWSGEGAGTPPAR